MCCLKIFHYLDCDLLSKTSIYNKLGAVDRKFNALKHNLTLDEFCFQYESVYYWSSLPMIVRHVDRL